MREQRQNPALGPEYRVRRHRPVCNAVVVVVAILLLGGGGWWLYREGVRDGGYLAQAARATEAHLRIQIEQLRRRIDKLARRNELLERVQRIDEQALARLREAIAQRERRITELKGKLALYRNLVSPSQSEPGLEIRRLTLSPVPGQARRYHYELVLTHLNSDDRYVSGHVLFEVEVRRRDGLVTFELEELADAEAEPETAFRFKYFQTLSGRFRLPEAVHPRSVTARAVPSGDRVDPVEQEFDWSSALVGGA